MSPNLYSAMATRSRWWTRSGHLFPIPYPHRTGSTHGSGDRSVCPTPVGVHIYSASLPLWHLDLLLPPLDPPPDSCAPERPHSLPATARCGLQDPLEVLHKGVHWPNRPHPRAPSEGTQKGTSVRGGKPVCSGPTWDERHDIDWEGATVVDVHPQFHQRCTL